LLQMNFKITRLITNYFDLLSKKLFSVILQHPSIPKIPFSCNYCGLKTNIIRHFDGLKFYFLLITFRAVDNPNFKLIFSFHFVNYTYFLDYYYHSWLHLEQFKRVRLLNGPILLAHWFYWVKALSHLWTYFRIISYLMWDF
jgi:hypothetical protein